MKDAPGEKSCTVILGGGLTGLSAGAVLSRAGFGVTVIEADTTVGGLSKTMHHNGFRFDLGGHRFFTTDEGLNRFVQDLMQDELITVPRSSKIYMRDTFLDYPLRPANAFFGLGIGTSLNILADFGIEKCRGLFGQKNCVSLEDWVIRNFGRTMFDIYFKVYSEKVWGIDCSRISAEWVDRRINGLSLAKALKNAFFRVSGKKIPTLVDEFFYPKLGIGRISDRLKDEIEMSNKVYLDTRVEVIHHDDNEIKSIVVRHQGHADVLTGRQFISSLPLTHVVNMLNPAPPRHILDAASRLKFRDLVVVAVMADKKRLTDQTWIYIPEKNIPFGRIHEPTNWSEMMAPEGKTLLVIEYFSFKGDGIWNDTDAHLLEITVRHLEKLGFLKSRDVCDGMVVRVPKAYPLFEVGYHELCEELYAYLGRFRNLHIAGRSGMFRYYNMDHAIESGIRAAEAVINTGMVSSSSAEEDAFFAGCSE
ncbi:MAG: FAD-dependent oxidoreductase [Nitrospirae bacterium]|nr:FAD-dependent oxidoreductase [Nitrospirota bacterium]